MPVIDTKACSCMVCAHVWLPQTLDPLPLRCAKCKSPGWNKLATGGIVYLVFAPDRNEYKIGRTRMMEFRLNCLKRDGGDERLEITHTIRTEKAAALETHLHGRFWDKRIRGEWFRLNESDVSSITAIKDGATVTTITTIVQQEVTP